VVVEPAQELLDRVAQVVAVLAVKMLLERLEQLILVAAVAAVAIHQQPEKRVALAALALSSSKSQIPTLPHSLAA
jgi:hypothetical protein